jgi:hypothetical protein
MLNYLFKIRYRIGSGPDSGVIYDLTRRVSGCTKRCTLDMFKKRSLPYFPVNLQNVSFLKG